MYTESFPKVAYLAILRDSTALQHLYLISHVILIILYKIPINLVVGCSCIKVAITNDVHITELLRRSQIHFSTSAI